jgi:hypothetical protein
VSAQSLLGSLAKVCSHYRRLSPANQAALSPLPCDSQETLLLRSGALTVDRQVSLRRTQGNKRLNVRC